MDNTTAALKDNWDDTEGYYRKHCLKAKLDLRYDIFQEFGLANNWMVAIECMDTQAPEFLAMLYVRQTRTDPIRKLRSKLFATMI